MQFFVLPEMFKVLFHAMLFVSCFMLKFKLRRFCYILRFIFNYSLCFNFKHFIVIRYFFFTPRDGFPLKHYIDVQWQSKLPSAKRRSLNFQDLHRATLIMKEDTKTVDSFIRHLMDCKNGLWED